MQVLVLSNIGLVTEAQGQYAAARDYRRSALTLAREIGFPQREALGLNGLGDALAGLEQWTDAEASYRAAVDLWDTLGQPHMAAESRAGLARATLAHGDEATALSQVEAVLSFLQIGGNLQGTENTLRIYLTCVQMLMATSDSRAGEFLDTTYRLLQKRVAKIADEAGRRMFLENVPWHREIVALWGAKQERFGDAYKVDPLL